MRLLVGMVMPCLCSDDEMRTRLLLLDIPFAELAPSILFPMEPQLSPIPSPTKQLTEGYTQLEPSVWTLGGALLSATNENRDQLWEAKCTFLYLIMLLCFSVAMPHVGVGRECIFLPRYQIQVKNKSLAISSLQYLTCPSLDIKGTHKRPWMVKSTLRKEEQSWSYHTTW